MRACPLLLSFIILKVYLIFKIITRKSYSQLPVLPLVKKLLAYAFQVKFFARDVSKPARAFNARTGESPASLAPQPKDVASFIGGVYKEPVLPVFANPVTGTTGGF
jgi:hypothetical protein